MKTKFKKVLRPILIFAGLTSLQAVDRVRKKLASQYLSGEGIEVGALHRPLLVNKNNQKIKVSYVDRLDSESIRNAYSELSDLSLVDVDIVDNGETLQTIEDASLDFIIANHFIEHAANPLGTIRNHLRKLKNNGILFYAIPNKRKTFDKDRSLTSFEHLLRDDQLGSEVSRLEHYREWVEKVLKINTPDEVTDIIEKTISSGYSIHYHVWDEITLIDFGKNIENLMKVELLEFCKVRDEIILIFRNKSLQEKP
jgi:SAM-dependent methyltransferase